MTHDDLQELQETALRDYHKGLLDNKQLINIIHALDRRSHQYGYEIERLVDS